MLRMSELLKRRTANESREAEGRIIIEGKQLLVDDFNK